MTNVVQADLSNAGTHLALGVVLLDVLLPKQSLHACLGTHAACILTHQLLVTAHHSTTLGKRADTCVWCMLKWCKRGFALPAHETALLVQSSQHRSYATQRPVLANKAKS